MAFIGVNASAQDVIVKRNGEELQCKILEVSKNEVKYKRWTNQDGPSFAEKKSEIFMIKYENGEKEVVAYESPALAVPSVTPSLSTSVPSEMTLADPTPISNVYLEYTTRGRRKSGIIKWGHMQSDEQAQSLLTNDWLDYKSARKQERTGKVLAITGGSLFLGGLWWTVYHIVYCKRYSDTEKEYDDMDKAAWDQYYAERNRLSANMNDSKNRLRNAKTEYEKVKKEKENLYDEYQQAIGDLNNGLISEYDVDVIYERYRNLSEIIHPKYLEILKLEEQSNAATYEYEDYTRYNSYYKQSRFYNQELEWDLDWYASEKEASLLPMLGGLTTGSALLIVGIIKAKRGHRNATQIVNKYNDEYEKNSKKTSMSKPEFNIGSKGNNLAFTLTF